MKNILSSLNESEKKRIIEMHTNKKSYLFEAVENKTVQLDCVAKTVNGIVVTQDNLLTNLCPAAKTTTTPAGTTPLDTYVSNMFDWRSSVINDKLASFGGSKVNVSGDEGVKMADTVSIEMKNPKEDPKMNNLIATPTYYCRYTNGTAAGSVIQYQLYFKFGSPEYKAFVEACKLQCQASQKKIQEVKFTKQ
jgi:hypothetical protein